MAGAATLAAVVIAIHALFVLFVAAGGLLALRWPRAAWLHLPAAAWGAFVEASGRECPLTPLEIRLRLEAGAAGYTGSFLDHYVMPVLYPPGLTRPIQLGLAATVVAGNAVLYALLWRRRLRRLRKGDPI